MVAKVTTTTLVGIDAMLVEIEAQIFGSLRRFSIVGLPDGVLRESKDRVRCAIENSGFQFPHHELIVSLAPAALPKFGSGFDLGIALAILAADGQFEENAFIDKIILGELALDGTTKAVPGTLAAACYAKENNFKELYIPQANVQEASLVDGIKIFPIESLSQAVLLLKNELEIEPILSSTIDFTHSQKSGPTFADVIGQHGAKRALEVAAAGGHNVLMVGPPGAGKTMLARRIASILPPLSYSEAIELTKIVSSFNTQTGNAYTPAKLIWQRPIRTPHHTTSTAGLIGGGTNPLPGEISMAHKGILFLDEFPEFRRDSLEALRQPLEAKDVVITRSRFRLKFPADFILIAAMNPCPCGHAGSTSQLCTCNQFAIQRYRSKISGPILDRIDIHLWVPSVPIHELNRPLENDSTAEMYNRVLKTRSVQAQRFKNSNMTNTSMDTKQIKETCVLENSTLNLLETATRKLNLSARSYSRVLKLARTIADLEESVSVNSNHVAEALSYRMPNGLS